MATTEMMLKSIRYPNDIHLKLQRWANNTYDGNLTKLMILLFEHNLETLTLDDVMRIQEEREDVQEK